MCSLCFYPLECASQYFQLQTKHTVNSEENGRKRSKKLTYDLATIKYRKGGLLNSGRLDDGVHSDWWPEEEEEEGVGNERGVRKEEKENGCVCV